MRRVLILLALAALACTDSGLTEPETVELSARIEGPDTYVSGARSYGVTMTWSGALADWSLECFYAETPTSLRFPVYENGPQVNWAHNDKDPNCGAFQWQPGVVGFSFATSRADLNGWYFIVVLTAR